MAGMVEENGHPYSWSAILNGYDANAMARCPYPAISDYLSKEPPEAFGIPGVKVTHVWCDQPEQSQQVAQASLIPQVAREPAEVIGLVDAVLIPTDKGNEHVERARPFLEAGLPVFIDKPLTDNEPDLRQFVRWHHEGKAFLSTSCMRYAREFACLRADLNGLGELRLITMTTSKSWERYGIHALEGVYPFLSPGGWRSVTNSGTARANIVHLQHDSGVDVVLAAINDLYGALGCLSVYGTQGVLSARFTDTFYAFKVQLREFIDYLRTGRRPVPFEETAELMKIIIAGIRSRDDAGRKISLDEILPEKHL